jgi:hypothetical protein
MLTTPFLTVRICTGFEDFIALLGVDGECDVDAIRKEISLVAGDHRGMSMSSDEARDIADGMKLPMIVLTKMGANGEGFDAVYRVAI